MAISVVGVDLSKSVFQLSIADSKHHVVDRKRLGRTQFYGTDKLNAGNVIIR